MVKLGMLDIIMALVAIGASNTSMVVIPKVVQR
jgi:hypothetical protein